MQRLESLHDLPGDRSKHGNGERSLFLDDLVERTAVHVF
jgi:hypothetical protein